jgi:hypothetical protein
LSYKDLDDEQKLEEAIRFVATGHPIPNALVEFLKEAQLYELVTSPRDIKCNPTDSLP